MELLHIKPFFLLCYCSWFSGWNNVTYTINIMASLQTCVVIPLFAVILHAWTTASFSM